MIGRFLGALWITLRREKIAVLGLALVLGWTVVALAAPFISPADPYELTTARLVSPSREHLLGTDPFGRDVLSQIVWGTRVSLLFGLGVAGLSGLVGIFLGAIPGYFGGLVDDVVSRLTEIFLMIPSLMLIILAVALFGSDISIAIVIVALTMWPANARIMRGQVLQIKARGYVLAALSYGAASWRVLLRHIFPNALPPVVANATLQMASAVIVEASLSFLGLGDPNHVSWGQILYRGQFSRSAWWLSIYSGLAIFLLVLGFNLLGDAVNVALNPRLRRG
ncbi:MAG: ABC transporter permease [Chloroflexi bacterium]|nr:ABC transporter permease [Chloroflexota bacterium]MCL5076479.1 ABC transporter permease [Chloroflexota bacterium]